MSLVKQFEQERTEKEEECGGARPIRAGVRRSSGAAISETRLASKSSPARSESESAAPGDGRTPKPGQSPGRGAAPPPKPGQPLSPEEVRSLDHSFNEMPTEKVLAWAWERYGTRAAI